MYRKWFWVLGSEVGIEIGSKIDAWSWKRLSLCAYVAENLKFGNALQTSDVGISRVGCQTCLLQNCNRQIVLTLQASDRESSRHGSLVFPCAILPYATSPWPAWLTLLLLVYQVMRSTLLFIIVHHGLVLEHIGMSCFCFVWDPWAAPVPIKSQRWHTLVDA